MKLIIESNGVLVTPSIAEKIAENPNQRVAISLDGEARVHDKIRGVKGAFEQAVKGIKTLLATGVHSQIIMTLMAENIDQIEDVIKLAQSLEARSVKFNIVQPSLRGADLHARGKVVNVDRLLGLYKKITCDLQAQYTPRLHFKLPHAFMPLASVMESKKIVPSSEFSDLFSSVAILYAIS